MFTDKKSFEEEMTKILHDLELVRVEKDGKCSKQKIDCLNDMEAKLESQYETLCDEYIEFCESIT
jgi:hypothetical protein